MSCSRIVLEEVAKKFQHKWIFKDLKCTFQKNDIVSVRGQNGAGKSTLLKIISGHLTPNQGAVSYLDHKEKQIARDDIYKEVAFAAPYISLLSRLNLSENIDFYRKFKSLQGGLDTKTLIDLMGLKSASHKELRFFSSGMLQRVKLALAMCTDSSILILDEPTSNLDEAGIVWYQETLKKYCKDRMVIIASNVEHDFTLCNRSISVLDFKAVKAKFS